MNNRIKYTFLYVWFPVLIASYLFIYQGLTFLSDTFSMLLFWIIILVGYISTLKAGGIFNWPLVVSQTSIPITILYLVNFVGVTFLAKLIPNEYLILIFVFGGLVFLIGQIYGMKIIFYKNKISKNQKGLFLVQFFVSLFMFVVLLFYITLTISFAQGPMKIGI